MRLGKMGSTGQEIVGEVVVGGKGECHHGVWSSCYQGSKALLLFSQPWEEETKMNAEVSSLKYQFKECFSCSVLYSFFKECLLSLQNFQQHWHKLENISPPSYYVHVALGDMRRIRPL